MNIKDFFINKLLLILTILVISNSTLTVAQQSMSLGGLKFVMPTEAVKASARTLSMRMATTGISARIISKVGGVAFIQTAVPDFNVNLLSLGVNEENKAYAIINDTIYDIPLEVWELQSIVNYAAQEDNAAVTLFGDHDARIKYHTAFLDNLMGLRILQTDLLLTGFLKSSDKGKLPSYPNGEYILSEKEKREYESYCIIDSLLYNISYEDLSQICLYKVMNAIDSIGEYFDTYIYTDYDQPIKFKLENSQIKIEGKPYYRFASRDSAVVDTLEMYYELKNFIDTINFQRDKYKKLSIAKSLKKSESSIIHDLSKLIKKNQNVIDKASKAFKETNYYALCDTFNINKNLFKRLIPGILKIQVEEFADSIMNHKSNNQELYNICKEYTSIKDSLKYYEYPIIAVYASEIYRLAPTDSTAIDMHEFAQKYKINYDRALIEYMYDHKILAAKISEKTTTYLRDNHTYTYMINPIVFNAVEKVCQWSAFFRFTKEYYNEEWQTFIEEVKKLKYDAPIVQTPIDFKYE